MGTRDSFTNRVISGLLSYPILYVSHFHYNYVREVLMDIVGEKGGQKGVNLPDGLCEFDFGLEKTLFSKEQNSAFVSVNKIEALLRKFADKGQYNKTRIAVIKNAEIFLGSKEKYTYKKTLLSLLHTFAQEYENGKYDELSTIILVSSLPISECPGIEKIAKLIHVDVPTEQEIKDYIERVGLDVSNYYRAEQKEEIVQSYIRTLQGLHMYDIKRIVRSTTIRTGGRISDKTIHLAWEEKKDIVRKSGIVEVIDADVTFDEIGGLGNLKTDLKQKSVIYNNLAAAKKYNITLPKGVLIMGMPGCGKSMIAKSIANEFGVSLLRLDVNRLMGQYVGQSERNLRYALEMAEAAHPCVLWIDEVEKAFAGTSGSGESNMLVMRLMGHFLTWMQERKTAVYIVATANDVMRPEFMRKGRFDEVYFVDFPNEGERVEILKKKLDRFSGTPFFDFSEINDNVLQDIAKKMAIAEAPADGYEYAFSGAEIESVVNAVVENKFVKSLEKKKKDSPLPKVKITKEDFVGCGEVESEIEKIMKSAMCNQGSRNSLKSDKEKSNIERIREVHRQYGFRNASDKQR